MLEEIRDLAAHTLRQGLVHRPVSAYFADDVSVLPMVQVGRPTLNRNDQLGCWQAELSVFVIGSRITDEQSQRDLDSLAWMVFTLLHEKAAPVPNGEIVETTVTSATPTVTPVAGQEYPSYIVQFVGFGPIC